MLYAIVVTVGFVADYAVFSALYYLGTSVYQANLAGFLVGGFVNVLLIRAFVFKDSRFSLATDLAATAVSNGLMFMFGTFLLWVMVAMFSVSPYAAKLIANGVTFAANYIIRASYFRTRPNVF